MESTNQSGADGGSGGNIDSDPRTLVMANGVADDTPICRACGADVRAESVFCYNCGKPVESDVMPEPLQTEPTPEPEAVADSPETPERPPLKSAASLRQKRRAMNGQPVEIAWEATNRTPIAFYVATVALTIGAIVLMVLALYLR